MKDFKSILLALLSIGLIGTWFFHFYEKSRYKSNTQETYVRDSATIAQIIKNVLKDSSQKIVAPKDDTTDSGDVYIDSLKARLDSSLNEVIGLKKEIDGILKNDQATQSDLSRSRTLIGDLSGKIDKLKSENKFLQSLKTQTNTTKQNNSLKTNEPVTNSSKRKPTKKDSIFLVSDINLSAVDSQHENKGASSVAEADKLIFSFIIRNNILQNSYYDVYVVIVGPENKVLQTDEWSAAENFFTSRTGKRAFTQRIRFEYTQGDPKKIVASIEPGKITKGLYTLKIYYNGIIIGQTKRPIG